MPPVAGESKDRVDTGGRHAFRADHFRSCAGGGEWLSRPCLARTEEKKHASHCSPPGWRGRESLKHAPRGSIVTGGI
jgi:hypothetical protein